MPKYMWFQQMGIFFFITYNILSPRLMHKIFNAYRRVLNEFYARLTTENKMYSHVFYSVWIVLLRIEGFFFQGGLSILMTFKRELVENLSINHLIGGKIIFAPLMF